MDVESRDGWTFLRLSFLLIIPDNEQTVLPAPRTLIRYARSAHFHRRKILKISFPIFLLFFFYLFSPPLQIWMRWRGILWCVWRVGFFILFSLLFLSEKMGGEFSDFQRFIVYIYPWTGMESGRVGCMAWTVYPRRGCSTLCRLMFVKCGGTPLLFFSSFIY